MKRAPHRIDVHHHITPGYFLEALAEAGIEDAGGVALHTWSPESQLSQMDRDGIAMAINSVTAPGASFGDPAKARGLARRLNEDLARLVADHPTRFGAFATLPLPDIDGALAEIEYAYDTLGVDGVGLLTSVEGRYLGDPAFEPVLAELDRRAAVVHVHPNVPRGLDALHLRYPEALVEFVFDTTRTVANLIYTGSLERFPNLSIILSHAGGTVPFVTGRLTFGRLVPELAALAPQGSTAYLKRLYYDTALASGPTALRSLYELVEPSQVLYGSDTPFLPEPMILSAQAELESFDGLTPGALDALQRDNALALFPRLRSLHASVPAAQPVGGRS